MNFSNASISSNAVWLISLVDAEAALLALMLLELLDFLELAAESGEDPFEMVPADAVCSSIYGGPETATVQGEWRGQPVDAIFSRDNGCEIARWDNAVALLAFQGQDAGLGGIQP